MKKTDVILPKSAPSISPFANESEVVSVRGLTIENRFDRVQIHGAVDITRDKAGLADILSLKRQIDSVAAQLKSESLPDSIVIDEPSIVENPFT